MPAASQNRDCTSIVLLFALALTLQFCMGRARAKDSGAYPDTGTPPRPPSSFFKLERVLKGNSLGVHVKPAYGAENGIVDRDLTAAEQTAFVQLLSAHLQRAIEIYGQQSPDELRASIGDIAIAVVTVSSTEGTIQLAAFERYVSPEPLEKSGYLGNRIDLGSLGRLRAIIVPGSNTDRDSERFSKWSFITDLAFSSDGKRLATAGAAGKIEMWDVQTGLLLRTWHNESEWETCSVALSPDETLVAVGGQDRFVRVWKTDGEGPIREIPAGGCAAPLRFTRDGRKLVGAVEGAVRVWRVEDWAPLCTRTYGAQLVALSLSPDDKRLAVCMLNQSPEGDTVGTVGIAELSDGPSKLHVLKKVDHQVPCCVTFHPNGATLATGQLEGTVVIWDAVSERSTAEFKAYDGGYVASVVFSPDGTLLATGGSNKTIRLWQTSNWSLLREMRGHEVQVGSLAFSADGSFLASGGGLEPSGRSAAQAFIWEVSSGVLLRRLVDTASSP